jgi:DNA-binding response OmpR family regulator
MAKILIVDDDVDLCCMIKNILLKQNALVSLTHCGEDALRHLSNLEFDAIVLDWSLPDLSGEDICRRYRNNDGQAPIIFLTGKSDIEFLERGLSAGADDYLRKPFDGRELVARLESLLRRRHHRFCAKLVVRDLLLKPESNQIVVGGGTVSLTPKETAILEYLMRHPDHIFSASDLLAAIWPAEGKGGVNTVRTWIGFLRHKLESVGYGTLIRTIPSVGYILDSEPR